MNKPVIVPTFSGPYLIRMAARACTEKIGEDTIRAMPHCGVQPHSECGQKFFGQIGVVTGDGGMWLRKQCLIMAKNNDTPASYWVSLPLKSLAKWIKASNLLVAEEKANRPKVRPRPVVIHRRR